MSTRNGPDSPAVNGTEQQQTDLFQNLEKLIASAVSICRLDGSVQCQIGGLITVIEELQRLLRLSFSEIKKLERNLEDQKHIFTNNIANLHYKVKEIQSDVETLKQQTEEARIARESSSSLTAVDAQQITMVDDSRGYVEKPEAVVVPNNLVDNGVRVEYAFAGFGQDLENDPSGQDFPKDSADDTGKKEAPLKASMEAPLQAPLEAPLQAPNNCTTPPESETTSENPSNILTETATSSSEERENALRILRSTSTKSDNSEQQGRPKRNISLKNLATNTLADAAKSARSVLPSTKSRHTKSPLVIKNPGKSPKTLSQKISRKQTPHKATLGKQVLNRNALKNASKRHSPAMQRKQIPQKLSKIRIHSPKRLKSPTLSPAKRKGTLLKKLQKKGSAVKISGSGFKKSTKIVVASSKKGSPLKFSKKLSAKQSSPVKVKQQKEASSTSEKAVVLEEKPIDKYINLDFLLNANQLMSELVADSQREEGTLDTASDLERRNIVDLAKLYRLRVRMASKCAGELPVALIKGRESSLPKPGQVDKLLYSMKHAMAIKQSKGQGSKHKLSGNGGRGSTASPAKKRKV